MNQLSERLNSLSPSATLAMSQKSGELKAQGVDVINMSVGEPDFNTPDHCRKTEKRKRTGIYSSPNQLCQRCQTIGMQHDYGFGKQRR